LYSFESSFSPTWIAVSLKLGSSQTKMQETAIENVVAERHGGGYQRETMGPATGNVGHWRHGHMRIDPNAAPAAE